MVVTLIHASPTLLSTLSLHDALPISFQPLLDRPRAFICGQNPLSRGDKFSCYRFQGLSTRSEEHTSELQSLRHLVCRLLLEKKKACASSRSPTAVGTINRV